MAIEEIQPGDMIWQAVTDDQCCNGCRLRDGMTASEAEGIICTAERCRCVQRPRRLHDEDDANVPHTETSQKLFRVRRLFAAIGHIEDAIVSLVHEREGEEQRRLRGMLEDLRPRANAVLMDALAGEIDRHEVEWIAGCVRGHLLRERASATGEPEERP